MKSTFWTFLTALVSTDYRQVTHKLPTRKQEYMKALSIGSDFALPLLFCSI
jgi:hypothetical protein